MRRNMLALYGFAAASLFLSPPARAEVINLSCDNGGMLITIDTDKGTVTDKNPFQKTLVTAPVAITDTAYRWHEGPPSGDGSADYSLDRDTRLVSGRFTSAGQTQAIQLSNPQCGKSATPRAKY